MAGEASRGAVVLLGQTVGRGESCGKRRPERGRKRGRLKSEAHWKHSTYGETRVTFLIFFERDFEVVLLITNKLDTKIYPSGVSKKSFIFWAPEAIPTPRTKALQMKPSREDSSIMRRKREITGKV